MLNTKKKTRVYPFLQGDFSREIVDRCYRIIIHQREQKIRSGLKGFLFWGPPGTGKTTCGKAIGEKSGVITEYYDCSHIARPKYGDSEKQIKQIFQQETETPEFRLIIFDDVDGLFITRSYGSRLDAWYLSHLNVLFHQLDELDTSKVMVLMTTNRKDLIDEALVDRLFLVEFPLPDIQTLKDYASIRFSNLGMNDINVQTQLLKEISQSDTIKTFRAVENAVIQTYVNWLEQSI